MEEGTNRLCDMFVIDLSIVSKSKEAFAPLNALANSMASPTISNIALHKIEYVGLLP